MKELTLTNVSGITPIDVYISDYSGNNKEFLTTIYGDDTFVITSSTFNTMSEIMVTFSANNGCETFKIIEC